MPLNTPNTTNGVSTYAQCVMTGGTQAIPSGNIDRRGIGAQYVSGTPSTSSVVTAQVPSSNVPVSIDTTNKPSKGRGYQALGTNCRATDAASTWVIGALELPLNTRLVTAH